MKFEQKMKVLRLLLSSTAGFYSFGTEIEIVWRRMDTQYTYKDSKQECSTKTNGGKTHIAAEAYLALEVVDGLVRAARFSNFPNVFPFKWIYKAIDLNSTELSTIKLYRDFKNQYWVKELTLSDRLVKWLIYYPSQDHFWCKAPFIPSSVNPKINPVVFEVEGLEEGIEVSYGDWIRVQGKLPDGEHFEQSLRLVQRKENM